MQANSPRSLQPRRLPFGRQAGMGGGARKLGTTAAAGPWVGWTPQPKKIAKPLGSGAVSPNLKSLAPP